MERWKHQKGSKDQVYNGEGVTVSKTKELILLNIFKNIP